jgi:ATP/maltotriose-dependent transcriptional regulator MalT
MREAFLPLADRPEEEEMRRRPRNKATARGLRSVEEDESLTRRERQVLTCFSQGLGTTAIAQRLSISATTVRNHSQRILTKLRVHSRLQAVARGYAIGLLSAPPRENE